MKGHVKNLQRVAKSSARTYLFAMDTLERSTCIQSASNRGAAAGGWRGRSLGVGGRGQVLEEASRREAKAEGTGRSIPEASLQPNQSQAQARQQQQ